MFKLSDTLCDIFEVMLIYQMFIILYLNQVYLCNYLMAILLSPPEIFIRQLGVASCRCSGNQKQWSSQSERTCMLHDPLFSAC